MGSLDSSDNLIIYGHHMKNGSMLAGIMQYADAAFAQAQARMEEHAAGDRVLLASARERAQALLEAYVRNIGAAVGREYAVRWELLEGEAPPPAEAEAPEGA